MKSVISKEPLGRLRNLAVRGFLVRSISWAVLEMTVLILPLHAAFDSAAAREAFEQGLAAKSEGRLGEAEHAFKQAVQAEPSNADYHFELANVFALEYDGALSSRDPLKAKETLAAAERELEQTVMIRPDFIAAHFNLGVVHKKQRKYEAARNEFKKAMELTPPGQPVTPFLMQIASIYEDQGFYDDAETVYQEAMEKDYGNPEIRNALETLGERRQWSAENARVQQATQMRNQWQDFSTGVRNERELGRAQQPGAGQLVPALGSWLVQQMMSRKKDQ